MKPILELGIGEGKILIQSREESDDLVVATSKIDDAVVQISEKLEQKLDILSNLAEAVIHGLTDKIDKIDSIEVEFGLSFTAKGSIYVVETEGEATFKVTIGIKPGRK